MIMKNKALVLDLDDTLYAEIDFLYSGYKQIAMRLEPDNWKMLFNDLVKLYCNGDNAFQYIADKYKVDLPTLLDWYRFHLPEIKLFPNVENILNHLKEDYKLAVITDGRSVTQRNKLKALNLEGILDYVVISEEIGSEKPSLKNFSCVQDELQCEKYIYLADNPKKILSHRIN